jgi:hypothetical protein
MDKINPDYYKDKTSLECIDAMRIIFGDDAVVSFCICNAFTYIWRWKFKNGEEDLRKADWFLCALTKLHSECVVIPEEYLEMSDRMFNYISTKLIDIESEKRRANGSSEEV